MYAGPRLHRMLSDLTGVLASSHRNPVVLSGDFNVTSQGALSSDNEAAAVFARLRAWRMVDCIAHKRAGEAGVADCKCPDGTACSPRANVSDGHATGLRVCLGLNRSGAARLSDRGDLRSVAPERSLPDRYRP
jgi:hypothetical protein